MCFFIFYFIDAWNLVQKIHDEIEMTSSDTFYDRFVSLDQSMAIGKWLNRHTHFLVCSIVRHAHVLARKQPISGVCVCFLSLIRSIFFLFLSLPLSVFHWSALQRLVRTHTHTHIHASVLHQFCRA